MTIKAQLKPNAQSHTEVNKKRFAIRKHNILVSPVPFCCSQSSRPSTSSPCRADPAASLLASLDTAAVDPAPVATAYARLPVQDSCASSSITCTRITTSQATATVRIEHPDLKQRVSVSYNKYMYKCKYLLTRTQVHVRAILCM